MNEKELHEVLRLNRPAYLAATAYMELCQIIMNQWTGRKSWIMDNAHSPAPVSVRQSGDDVSQLSAIKLEQYRLINQNCHRQTKEIGPGASSCSRSIFHAPNYGALQFVFSSNVSDVTKNKLSPI